MDVTLPQAPHSDAPIGIFDSGVGGLSVLDVIAAVLPNERFIYIGDTEYLPYGSQPRQVIAQRAATLLRWLQRVHGVKAMVVACNTSAAVLGDQLPRMLPAHLPWVDPITPLCTDLDQRSPDSQTYGLLATPGTVASGRHQALLTNCLNRLIPIPCDGLAAMVERGDHLPSAPGYAACSRLLQQTLPAVLLKSLDGLILACTHYPHAQAAIQGILNAAGCAALPMLNPAKMMADSLKAQLAKENLLAASPTARPNRFYVTQNPKAFFMSARHLPLRHVAVTAVELVVLI